MAYSEIEGMMRVAVVGAGPSGLAAAMLLIRQGVDVTIYERRPGTSTLPCAHVVNCRTTEIFRELGVFDQLAAAAAPADRMGHVTWSESLAGVRYGRLPYQGDAAQHAERLAASPARTINIGQDRLERILAARLQEMGGKLCFGHRVVDIDDGEDGARLTIVDAGGVERSAMFDFVLACDGASSSVRRALGIEMEGPASLARIASAYFEADLAPYLGEHVGPVHFVCNGDVRGAIIGFDLDRMWALMTPMPPDKGPEDFSAPVMAELVRRAIGDPDAAVKLIEVGSWNMSAQVAAQFRKGRFFLVGDSAHRFPPSGGLGLNTGVQDAHNLAWKLAFVVQGKADLALLDSYDAERRPIAQRNCGHSVSNAMRMAEVDATIGVSLNEPVDPAAVRRPPAPTLGWTAAPDALDEAACRARTQSAIDAQRPHFDSLAMEIGYAYGPDAGEGQDRDRYQVLANGMRLPHCWIDAARGVSSHDLVSRSGLTLVSSNPAWQPLTDQLRLEFRLIGQTDAALPAQWREAMGERMPGAILVRPDDHVAWIGPSGPSPAASSALAKAVAECTGKSA